MDFALRLQAYVLGVPRRLGLGIVAGECEQLCQGPRTEVAGVSELFEECDVDQVFTIKPLRRRRAIVAQVLQSSGQTRSPRLSLANHSSGTNLMAEYTERHTVVLSEGG